MIRRRLTGLAATLGIAALLIGLPTLLLKVGFGNLPPITSWSDLSGLLLRRDDGTLALLVIKLVGWIAWALLAALIILETISLARGIQPRDLPGLRMPQSAARHLVAAAAALFIALPAAATPTPALADATPTPAVASTFITTSSPAAEGRRPARAATESSSASRLETRPHTVKRGESLWSIAEKELGNGRRYTEIAALNSTLLDGKGDDFLKTGWILNLPADPTSQAEPAKAVTRYTVKKGDTLSEIALDHLGDAAAYPRIVHASRNLTQPGGRHLTDADVIDVGWTLHIPHPGNADERPADSAEGALPAAAELKPGTQAPASAQPVANRSAEPATSAPQSPPATGLHRATSEQAPATETLIDQVDTDGDEQSVPGWLVGGLAGAGALLGGSMWLALRRRRAAQFRFRRPGRMIATPSPAVVPIEKTLATGGATALPTVEFVDEALRRLAAHHGRARQPMPKLAALELSDTHLTLHLSEAADLPAPWAPAPDPLRWEIAFGTDLAEVGPLDPAVQAPFPQLVAVGEDDELHRWLLNLEDSAVLQLTGDPDHVRDFARYVAAELALHPWSVDVEVECVGIAHEIVALNPRRVRHHETDDIAAHVLADAVTMIDRTAQADTDIATARATLVDADLWQSRLLLLDAVPRSQHVDQLARLLRTQPGRTGTVLVLVHDTAAAAAVEAEEIHLTSAGRLRIPSVGLDLVAVGLTSDEAVGCAALVAQAGNDTDRDMPTYPEPADGWQGHANRAGQLLPDHTLPRTDLPADDAVSLLPEPDEVYVDVAATTPEDLATLAPRVSAKVRAQVEASDPTLDDDLSTWNDPHCDLPKLKVLGPLTVRVAPTGRPTAAAGRKPYLSELLAFLATRPHGATTDEVAEAMGISTDRVRKDILTLRTWLGPNPRTSRPHIPDSRQTDAAKTRGRPTYQVEGLLTDADLFRRLRVRGETRGPDGLNDLRQALSLVTGTPYSQLRNNGGAWLADGDRLDQILLCAIVDVAHLLTTADLQLGHLTDAQGAAELALRVAPNEETSRLDLAAVFDAQGHQHAADQLIRNDVCDRSDDEDGIPAEISQRTAQIIDQRQWLTHTKTRASA